MYSRFLNCFWSLGDLGFRELQEPPSIWLGIRRISLHIPGSTSQADGPF